MFTCRPVHCQSRSLIALLKYRVFQAVIVGNPDSMQYYEILSDIKGQIQYENYANLKSKSTCQKGGRRHLQPRHIPHQLCYHARAPFEYYQFRLLSPLYRLVLFQFFWLASSSKLSSLLLSCTRIYMKRKVKTKLLGITVYPC